MVIRGEITDHNLESCLAVNPAGAGFELAGRERALRAWKTLLKSPSFKSVVLESSQRGARPQITGFGAGVFATKTFLDHEMADPAPGLNARLIAGIAGGKSVVLTDAELRRANTDGGLCQIILYATWRRDTVAHDLVSEIQTCLASSYLEQHTGYCLQRLLTESTDEIDIRHAQSTGVWRLLDNFAAFHSTHPGSLWNRCRALYVLEREDALHITGSVASLFFQYQRPMLRFRNCDQQLLTAALEGHTDKELSQVLGLKHEAVKKRWASVFNQVSARMPELLPEPDLRHRTSRGLQKRHHLLSYLRRHPEELRPLIP